VLSVRNLVKPALISLLLLVVADLRAQLKSEPAALDLGQRKQEQVVISEVKLSNAGSTTIEITGVFADCSCTVATPEKRLLAPGESTPMKISIETRAYQGAIHRNVRVQTSVGELIIPIELTVSLYKSWLLEPATIVMPPSQKGHEASMLVALKYSGDGKATLGKISCTPAWLEVVPSGADGIMYSLKFVKKADAPAGNHTVKVVVETSDPEESSLTFNVFVPITSALRIMPNPAVLPTVKVGQPTVREIVVHGWNGTDDPRLELTLGQAKILGREGDKVRFEISVTPPAPGPLTQLLRIYDGDKLEAEIPVILRAEPADKNK
jgi:hypothetical protein